jgi:hypothetical protein
MFLFRYRAPLWFFQGAGSSPTDVTVCVSVAYNLSASIQPFDRDIELSALAFNLSANLQPGGVDDINTEVQVGIDLDDQSYSTVDLRASITPVFVLSQTGGISKDVAAAYNLTASVTATIFPDNVLSLAYGISASVSAVLLISDNFSVALAYNVTASIQFILEVQTDTLSPQANVAYGISCSISPSISIGTTGGLVWSRKKQRYIAVRAGS